MWYYLARIKELGPYGCWQAGARRAGVALCAWRWRRRAVQKAAGHQWSNLVRQRLVPATPNDFTCWQHFLHTLQSNYQHPLLWTNAPSTYKDSATLFGLADQLSAGTMTLFGTSCSTNAWHTDDRTPHQAAASPQSWQTTWYQDIAIGKQSPATLTEIPGPDVKVPWDRSRLHHAVLLGYAYQQALEQKSVAHADRYATQAIALCQNWIDHNPWLIGINWTCAMEVGIRAINLLWTAALCSAYMTQMQHQKLIASLFDHLVYLEHHWETSDRPNNHYLADLLGAWYLRLALFGPADTRTHRMATTVKKQLQRQLLPDGTAYEGSTAYHRLDTEMAAHGALLDALFFNDTIGFAAIHTRMHQFVQDCTMPDGTLVQIGDNDSGNIVLGYATPFDNMPRIKHYPDFGIIIAHHLQLSCTFRYPAHQPHQPTGHFHDDALSLCVWHGTNPLIIDAGTGHYTAHAGWRQLLAGPSGHSTIWPLNHQAATTLFARKVTTGGLMAWQQKAGTFTAEACTTLVQRTVLYQESTISIHDKTTQQASIQWLLGPEVRVSQQTATDWLLSTQNGAQKCSLHSSIPLQEEPAFYSNGYGHIGTTTRLVGVVPNAGSCSSIFTVA